MILSSSSTESEHDDKTWRWKMLWNYLGNKIFTYLIIDGIKKVDILKNFFLSYFLKVIIKSMINWRYTIFYKTDKFFLLI